MLFIICLCASWMLAEYLPFEHMNLFKHILESNNLFCMEYLCFSCIFLVFDAFSVWKVLICVLTFESILLFILFIKKVQRKKWLPDEFLCDYTLYRQRKKHFLSWENKKNFILFQIEGGGLSFLLCFCYHRIHFLILISFLSDSFNSTSSHFSLPLVVITPAIVSPI